MSQKGSKGEEYETIATRRPRRAATQSVSYQTKPARAIRTTRSSTRKRSQPATSPPPSPPSPPSPVEISVKKVDAPDKETKQEPYSMEIDESKQEQSHPTRIRLRLHSPERSTSPVSEKPIKRKRKAGRPRKNESSHRITLSTGNHKKVKGLSHSIEDADEADNEMDDRLQKNNDDDQSTIKNEEVTSKEDKSKEGNNMKLDVDSEENEIIDEKGEQKITKDGELLGGRKYKVPVFQLESRESTLYMCSMEPAKCLGFRDSYLFFSKNPSLKRISATDEEREWLVANGYLPSNFRNRAITIVSARSIFKLFGYKIVLGGKRRRDDYFESNINYDDNNNSDQGFDSENENANNVLSRRSNYMPNPRALISETNWMYHVALSCRDFNNRLNIHRSEKTKFYDPHTNNEQIPRDTQPTRIQVEMVSSPHFYIRKGQTTTIEPELQFKPRFINPLGKLTTGVTEVLPPDIKEIVENMKKNEEAAECKIENKYPLALMDSQFQTSFPIQQNRFLYDSNSATTMNTTPATLETFATEDQIYLQQRKFQLAQQVYNNQTNNQLGRSFSQYTSSKANPQYICGVITATTGQPCRRAVTAEGERCMYHKETVQAPTYIGKSVNRSKTASSIVESMKASNAAANVPLPNMQLHPILSPNACAICYSLVVPSTIQLPLKVACSTEHTTQCSQCNRKYHPICLGLNTPKLMVSIESYQWQCNDCKTCTVCKSSGDEATLLICDDCDRAWHLDCSSPKVTEVPQGPWLCSLCAQCDSCGEKATSLNDAANNYIHKEANSDNSDYPIYLATICNRCEANFSADRFCPVCLKTYSDADDSQDDDDKDMVCCDDCDSWIHARCDPLITPERYKELVEEDAKYRCPLCDGRIEPLKEGDEEQILALSGSPMAIPASSISQGRYIRGIVNFRGKNVAVPVIRGGDRYTM